MKESQVAISLHGLVGLVWFAFGTLGLQSGSTTQAGIGFGAGIGLLLIGFIVARVAVDDDSSVEIA